MRLGGNWYLQFPGMWSRTTPINPLSRETKWGAGADLRPLFALDDGLSSGSTGVDYLWGRMPGSDGSTHGSDTRKRVSPGLELT